MNDNISKRPIVVLACQVFQDLFERFVKDGQIQKFIYLDYGLHSITPQVNQAVQEALDNLAEPSLVILGYGLCGKWSERHPGLAKHTLLIARASDCIAIFLGSTSAISMNSIRIRYVLSNQGWLESGSNPLRI